MAIPGYRILKKIRQGGMSTVYLANQLSVGREVAIKVMSPSLNSDPSFGSRFYREAKIVGQLSHPNIVSIYDVGSHRQYNYIAMDYLPGLPLQDRLDHGISPKDAIRIIKEIAIALDYAHQRGYVHRDIKPDNILFREDDTAVLCDFGIAKALKNQVKMTQVGSVLGTPHYMSPEQAQGKEIDGRADLYSLGVVFYQMISGQVPFDGDDAVAIAVKHMTSPIPKLPGQHKALQPLIEKMMSKKTAERFQSGTEIVAALDEYEHNATIRKTPLLTPTGATTVQILGLIKVLIGSLSNAVVLAIKRLMLTQVRLRPSNVQLTNKQLEDIDQFVLSENDGDLPEGMDDVPLIQDTIEQPATRINLRRFCALLAALLVTAGIGYWYFQPLSPRPTSSEAANAKPYAIKPIVTAVEEATEPAVNPALNDLQPPDENQAQVPEPSAETIPDQAIDQPESTDAANASEPAPKNYSLTVNSTPSSAKVRILNIKPRYHRGMLLSPGAYHIEVSAAGHEPKRLWLRIKSANRRVAVSLKPIQKKVLPAGSTIQDTLANGAMAPQMVVLPASDNAEPSIAMGQYEVSFDDYDEYARQQNQPLPDDKGWGRGKRPVIYVSYQDAEDYARWLSAQTGHSYRLPSRAEWQHGASAGQSTTYWWGDSKIRGHANCRRGCFSKFAKLLGTRTAPAGEYPANDFGLQNTSGNVAEWVEGCEDADCNTASIAGGSHQDNVKALTSRSLKVVETNTRSKAIGFRLVRELSD